MLLLSCDAAIESYSTWKKLFISRVQMNQHCLWTDLEKGGLRRKGGNGKPEEKQWNGLPTTIIWNKECLIRVAASSFLHTPLPLMPLTRVCVKRDGGLHLQLQFKWALCNTASKWRWRWWKSEGTSIWNWVSCGNQAKVTVPALLIDSLSSIPSRFLPGMISMYRLIFNLLLVLLYLSDNIRPSIILQFAHGPSNRRPTATTWSIDYRNLRRVHRGRFLTHSSSVFLHCRLGQLHSYAWDPPRQRLPRYRSWLRLSIFLRYLWSVSIYC